VLLPESAIRGGNEPVQVTVVPGFISIDDTLTRDQGDGDAHGEGPAAEPEAVDLVSFIVGATEETVDLFDVAGQPSTKGEPEDGHGGKGRGSNPVVIKGDLSASVGKIEGLIGAPDVGLVRGRGAVAGAV